MRIDGYAMDEADGSCCVFISDYRGPYESDTINKDVIDNSFKKIRYFVNESIKYELYQELEESTQVYEFSRMLHYYMQKTFPDNFLLYSVYSYLLFLLHSKMNEHFLPTILNHTPNITHLILFPEQPPNTKYM